LCTGSGPNSLRYRLRRIAELTGLDPARMSDLLELLAASRLIRDEERAKLLVPPTTPPAHEV